jgi:hypothetical protein
MTRTESAKAAFEGCLIDTDAVLHAPFTTYMMAAMPWFASMPHSVSGQRIAHGHARRAAAGGPGRGRLREASQTLQHVF